MIDNWKTSFQTGDFHWMLGCFILQEWEGLDNIPNEGGALIIYYHGVSEGYHFIIIGLEFNLRKNI